MAQNQHLPELEAQLDSTMSREMSAETVYRVLRAKIDRLSQRIAVLEDQAAPSVERVGGQS